MKDNQAETILPLPSIDENTRPPVWENERERRTKADTYFNDHLSGQQEWYSKNASKSKRIAQLLSLAVLFCGVLTTLVQVFDTSLAVRLITAVLGVAIVLAKGIERIYGFDDTWTGYRKASEAMKREYRLYINNTGDYSDVDDEENAYRCFVEQVELILAEEGNLFWQKRSERKIMPDQRATESKHSVNSQT